jgi:hypothetical protein
MESFLSSLAFDFTTVGDGKALAVSVSELFTEFPYNRVEGLPLAFWFKPLNVIVLVVLYLLSIPTLAFFFETAMKLSPKDQEAQWSKVYEKSKKEKQRRLSKAEKLGDKRTITKLQSDVDSFTFDKFKLKVRQTLYC